MTRHESKQGGERPSTVAAGRHDDPRLQLDYAIVTRHDAFCYEVAESEHIRLDDIVTSLSRQCRFLGHTSDAFPLYSIAQHACYVCDVLLRDGHGRKVAFMGLHHDDSEAYTGDMPAPLKAYARLHTDFFDDMEAIIQNAIYRRLGLDDDFVADNYWAVKQTDIDVYFAERAVVAPTYLMDGPEGGIISLDIVPWTHDRAASEFLKRHHSLNGA